MALLQGSVYLKISRTSIDYIAGKATVTLLSYASKNIRDTEKRLSSETSAFLFRASQSLSLLEQQLSDEQIAAGLTNTNAEEVFSKNPKLRQSTNKYYSLRADNFVIRSSLGKRAIEKSQLKFLSFWESLGLTEELRTTLIANSPIEFSIPIPDTTDLSSIYVAIKDRFPNVVDC